MILRLTCLGNLFQMRKAQQCTLVDRPRGGVKRKLEAPSGDPSSTAEKTYKPLPGGALFTLPAVRHAEPHPEQRKREQRDSGGFRH